MRAAQKSPQSVFGLDQLGLAELAVIGCGGWVHGDDVAQQLAGLVHSGGVEAAAFQQRHGRAHLVAGRGAEPDSRASSRSMRVPTERATASPEVCDRLRKSQL
ncbi:MAG: hypothetical protein COW42_08545 [Deltaproteobacteria bacterium CG17_big_fil_post_rev_8_21_14_2_50_63_7]|nr:MAG: hypothetical protein COW42_08545 [Deltaproteobacteria bacterium CG17_big_fil_post_rev_8_21_14_2_50_63_7]